MDFKDKINDAIKEGNIDHIADLLKSEQDQEWLQHGGPFGRPVFGNINNDSDNSGGNGNDKSKSRSKSKSQPQKEEKEKEKKPKHQIPTYKYSKRGKIPLHEAIILEGKPCYIYHGTNSKSFITVEVIEEETRVLRPPHMEEYPYTPYEFKDKEELDLYYQRASKIKSIAELYKMNKQFWQMYVDQDSHVLITLASDAVLSYFQDLFSTIHYIEGVGDVDVGKSSIGYTFEYTGYRVITGSDISGPNYYRIIGPVEPGQCVIIEDEGDNISEDPDKMKILKSGYEYAKKVPKTNMNVTNQDTNWYYPYCIKMILAEKSLSQYKAKGLVDRTFTFNCRPGKIKHAIKKVISDTIRKSAELTKLYNELLDFRKLMLCYRLISYTRDLPEIETSLSNRNLELTEPILQLFYGTDCFEEIRGALEYFINQRKERKSTSLEAVLYHILKSFIERFQVPSQFVTIQYSDIWTEITGGAIAGTYNENKESEYESTSYGTLYRDTLSRIIADKFGVKLIRNRLGSVLKVDVEKLKVFADRYPTDNNQQQGQNWVKIKVWLKGEKPPEEDSCSSFMGDGSDTSDGNNWCVDIINSSNIENPSINQAQNEQEIIEKNIDAPSNAVTAVTPSHEEPEQCPNCDQMVDPFDKNTHPACCSGRKEGV